MKRILMFVIVIVVLLLATAVKVQAQQLESPGEYYLRLTLQRQAMINRGGTMGGGGYYGGYYDPTLVPYIQQMMRLPDGLAACSVDFSVGKVTSCRPIVKSMGAIQAYLQSPGNGLFGTVHAEKGKMHFRPFDDTNSRMGTMSAGALGAGAGALIGYGATRGMANRNVGNLIGSAATVGGGLLAGFLASRHTHNNCLVLEPSQAHQATSEASPVTVTPVAEREESVSVVPQPVQPVVVPTVAVEKIIRNRFEDAPIRVYEGSELIVELKAGEKDGRVRVSSQDKIWGEAYLKNPANGKCEWIPLALGQGMDQLPQGAGWVFGNPNTRPNINGGGK